MRIGVPKSSAGLSATPQASHSTGKADFYSPLVEHDNPEIRRPEEMADFLGRLYNREVSEDDTVTVIRFSAIR